MRRRPVRFVALALVLFVALGACSSGGGGTISADAYASSVCSHIKTWLDQIKQRAADLRTAVSSQTSPTKGKDLLGTYLDGVISDTDDMVDAIKDAGTPDVPNGDDLSTTLLAGLEKAKAAFEDARGQIDALPTSSRAAFARAAEQVGSSINAKVGGVVQSFRGLKSPELDTAFHKVPACQGS
jgi:hypothetical protein